MSVLDTSAIVAIMLGEPERQRFLEAIEEQGAIASVVSVFEAALVLSRTFGDAASALSEVQRFLDVSRIAVCSVDASMLPELALAHDRYGKGRGHPAQLNMGDCFAYATTKIHGLPLIYKGNDFAQTDIR